MRNVRITRDDAIVTFYGIVFWFAIVGLVFCFVVWAINR